MIKLVVDGFIRLAQNSATGFFSSILVSLSSFKRKIFKALKNSDHLHSIVGTCFNVSVIAA